MYRNRANSSAAFLSFLMLLTSVNCSAESLPPKVYVQTPTGINLGDGTFYQSEDDLSVGQLILKRIHVGGAPTALDNQFGPTWSHSFNFYVTQVPTGAPMNGFILDVHLSGRVYSFSGDFNVANPSPFTDDEDGAKLEVSGDNIKFTDRDGDVYNFSRSLGNKVTNLTFADGRTVTFSYDGSQLLKEVSDSSGYAIVLDYNSSSLVTDACAVNVVQSSVTPSSVCSSVSGLLEKVSYGYTNGMLTSVNGRLGETSNYDYSGNNIVCVRPPGYGASCKITNTYGLSGSAIYQVISQTLATGEIWHYSYSGIYGSARAHFDTSGVVNTTIVTDPSGNSESYSFNGMSPVSATDANNRRTIYNFVGDQYHAVGYGSGTYLAEVDFPEGNKILQGFDSRMNVSAVISQSKPASGGSTTSTSTSSFFPSAPQTPALKFCNTLDPRNCNQPVWKKDANGNETDFTYDTNSGAVASILEPAPSINTPRPLKLYGYVQASALVRDVSGNLVAAPPMWLPGSETQCQTVAGGSIPVCDPNALQTVTTYEYGAQGTMNQLLLKGKVVSSGGASLRTCFSYDWKGDKISETSPRAGLVACS